MKKPNLNLCVDCKYYHKPFGTMAECKLHRTDYECGVTGKRWYSYRSCVNSRTCYFNCDSFEKRPNIIQRFREVFS